MSEIQVNTMRLVQASLAAASDEIAQQRLRIYVARALRQARMVELGLQQADTTEFMALVSAIHMAESLLGESVA